MRILVPGVGLDAGTCIDEIEVYEDASDGVNPCTGGLDVLTAATEGGVFAASNLAAMPPRLLVTRNRPGFGFDNPTLAPVEEGGSFAEDNLATMEGVVPFAIDSLACCPDVHNVGHLNDGLYGNSNSWIGETGAPAFAGLSFPTPVTVRSFAFGRDNGGEENQFVDRAIGAYQIQTTSVAAPDEFTPDEDWTTVAEFSYVAGCPGSPWLRHRFNFDADVELTGFRIVVPLAGIGGGTCIDEIELYESPGNEIRTVTHPASNVNDGNYGDASTWQSSGEEAAPFVGLALGGSFSISSLAFGRDNGGEDEVFRDATLGQFILQTTAVADPDENTPDADWSTVGLVSYSQGELCPPQPQERHRYDFAPVDATGVRILTPRVSAIDEIEVYEAADGSDLCSQVVVPCTDPEQTMTLAQTGGFFDENNLALEAGVTAFALDSLACCPEVHSIPHLNDGIYGNSNSWIGETGNPGFAGLSLGGLVTIGSIAWGRDNGGEANEFIDRAVGTYCVEYTTVAAPDETTPNEDWTTLATVDYVGADPPLPHLRHRWDFESPIQATGVRIVVSGVGVELGTCIDEIELYEEPCGDDCDPISVCRAEVEDLTLIESGGPFTTPSLPFDVPSFEEGNQALALDAMAFATPTLDGAPQHAIAHLNDGTYGNDNSWIAATPGASSGEHYAGIYFTDDARDIGGIALGRDNLGLAGDRVFGCYEVQVTPDEFDPVDDAAVAAAGWITVGEGAGHVTDGLPVGLRRRYEFPTTRARAVRVLVSGQVAIDEIELYAGESTPRAEFIRGNADGQGGLNLTDGIFLFNFLFLGGPPPTCREAADANNDGELNLTDGIVVLNFQFLGGSEPAPPGPRDCGVDPDEPGSPGDLGCETTSCP